MEIANKVLNNNMIKMNSRQVLKDSPYAIMKIKGVDYVNEKDKKYL